MDGNQLANKLKPGGNVTDTGSVTTTGMTLSPQEAADYAGISRSSINNHLKGKATPTLKAHRGNDANQGWRIRPDDLDAWMREKGIKKPSPAGDNGSANTVTIPVPTTTPAAGEGAILRATITGLEARLADAHGTITDLRTRLDAKDAQHREALDAQTVAHRDALGAAEARHRQDMQAAEDRHKADMIGANGKIEEVLGRERKLLEGQAASAKAHGEAVGKVGILTGQLEEAQRQAQEAQKQAKEAELALERAKAPEQSPRPSGGLVARFLDTITRRG